VPALFPEAGAAWPPGLPFFAQQLRLLEVGRGAPDRGKRKLRFRSNVEQRMIAVGLVEHPQHGELARSWRLAAYGPIKPPLSKARLSLGAQVDIAPVVFKHLDQLPARLEAARKRVGREKRKIVGGAVIL